MLIIVVIPKTIPSYSHFYKQSAVTLWHVKSDQKAWKGDKTPKLWTSGFMNNHNSFMDLENQLW